MDIELIECHVTESVVVAVVVGILLLFGCVAVGDSVVRL